MDLADLRSGRLGVQRAARLTDWLPDGARVWQCVGSNSSWTQEAHLIAGVFDVLQAGNWQRGGAQGSRPKPLPRPKELKEQEQRQARTLDRAQRFMRENAVPLAEDD